MSHVTFRSGAMTGFAALPLLALGLIGLGLVLPLSRLSLGALLPALRRRGHPDSLAYSTTLFEKLARLGPEGYRKTSKRKPAHLSEDDRRLILEELFRDELRGAVTRRLRSGSTPL